jgi:hypothetical protein
MAIKHSSNTSTGSAVKQTIELQVKVIGVRYRSVKKTLYRNVLHSDTTAFRAYLVHVDVYAWDVGNEIHYDITGQSLIYRTYCRTNIPLPMVSRSCGR